MRHRLKLILAIVLGAIVSHAIGISNVVALDNRVRSDLKLDDNDIWEFKADSNRIESILIGLRSITNGMHKMTVASSDPNVDYILKGRSERIATYMKCSLSNEYCMCVDQVVRKGGEVFRCSVFLHTNNAYIVWQDASFSEAPQFAECAREVSALQGGANIKCEVKAIGPELAQKVRQLHALWGESRYERMAWGSGIGHVVIILQGQGKESIALYDRPVWEEKQDMRKVFYCRDVYGEESACRYSCFLRVYRLLQNLLITECKQTK